MYAQNLEERKTISTQSKARTNGSRIGRPTKEESARRHEELLETALDIFLERGYEQTTMVEIASAVGMSKRTLYGHYADKDALFKAAVQRAIDRHTVSPERLQALTTDDLEETLLVLARLRIANVATPTGIKLQRILNGQSFRFPELFNAFFEIGTGPAITFLSDLFEQFNARGETNISETRRAAVAFFSLVVSGPVRIIASGNPLTEEEIEERIHYSVQLFLNGVRPR